MIRLYKACYHSLLIQAESPYHIVVRQFAADVGRYGFFESPNTQGDGITDGTVQVESY